jgi:hypothetical protein
MEARSIDMLLFRFDQLLHHGHSTWRNILIIHLRGNLFLATLMLTTTIVEGISLETPYRSQIPFYWTFAPCYTSGHPQSKLFL